MKILIADDSQLIRKIITSNLVSLGVGKDCIIEAQDGDVAFRSAGKIKDLEVVITDIAMPKIDGIKLIGMLRDDDRFRGITIVVISGTLDEDTKQKLSELNVTCFLDKPFNKDKFMELMNPIIQAALQGRSAKTSKDENENRRLILEALGRSVKEARVEKYDLVLEFEESEIYIDLDEFLKLAKYKPKTRYINTKEESTEEMRKVS